MTIAAKKVLFIFFITIIAHAPVNAALTVEITSPANGAQFAPCDTIPVQATATSSDAAIRYVRLYSNNNYKGRASAQPYEFILENVPSGFYELTAKVIDVAGNELFSEPVTITVGDNQDGNMIANGTFDCDLAPWTTYRGDEVDAEVYIETIPTFSDSAYAYVVVLAGTSNLWSLQFMQDMPIYEGHTYTIYFSAEALEEKKIGIAFQHKNDPWPVRWVNQDIMIDTETEYGPYEFVCTEDDPQAQFKFLLGGSDIDVAIDNVRVIDIEKVGLKVDDETAVSDFQLYPNYPNPFNPKTTILYEIPRDEFVELSLYNVLGERVERLVQSHQLSGEYRVTWDASRLPSSVYYAVLQAGDFVARQKLLLMK